MNLQPSKYMKLFKQLPFLKLIINVIPHWPLLETEQNWSTIQSKSDTGVYKQASQYRGECTSCALSRFSSGTKKKRKKKIKYCNHFVSTVNYILSDVS